MKAKNIYCWRNIAISFLAFLVMYYLISFSPFGLTKLEELTNGHSILDMKMDGYSVDEAYEILNELGEEGRAFEIKYIVPLDLLFPLTYGIFYFLLLSFLTKNILSKMKKPWLFGILGFFAMLFDYLENIMVIQLLKHYPQRLEGIAKAANIFTRLKSAFTIICMLLILIGLILWLMKKIIQKYKEKQNAVC